MICFLTSNPFLENGSLNPANGFERTLLDSLPQRAVRGLFVASSPDEPETNAFYAAGQRALFESAGIEFEDFNILERASGGRAAEWVRRADLMILSGGHVPTQNSFFQDIGLKALLTGFDGVLIGISAGTMNAAEVVYAQPELEGEAVDPNYRRFLPGLGLTRTMVIPHFDGNMSYRLDGLRVWADVTFPDSIGRRFYALPDGSYLYLHDGVEELRGASWRIENGRIRLFSVDKERINIF